MYDIIIVGAGPAGMTAALYALRANKKVLVLEAKTYGGQIIKANKVENYPGIESISGVDFATNLYNQVKNLGGEVKFETVIRITDKKEVITSKNTYQAKAVILATGADNRKLNIEHEQEFVGKGISYCATCDGNFFKDKVVAVIGGGNTALEDAIYLADIASKVYLIHRRDSFKAEDRYVSEAREKDNIEFIFNSNVSKLIGSDQLEEIEIKSNMGDVKTIAIAGLFIAVGQEPKNEIFADIIELNQYGYIVSSDGVHTNKEGIYVAGDCRVKTLRQLTTAVSDGSIAATIAMREMR
ncbi:MAG: thioredoxin-disulfide reductase [Bacilli bacterium]|nr:thioredoxin-disulfide reductase [Bacilli bacterium]